MNSRIIDKCVAAGIIIVIALLYSLMFLWSSPALDDWAFKAIWSYVNGKNGPSLGALYDFWKDIRLYDNGRLANVVAPLSTSFSPWKEIFPFASGILVAIIVTITTYFSFRCPIIPTQKTGEDSSGWFRPLKISVVWLFILFFLPWRNNLFIADYSLNYVWSAAITMLFMACVLHMENTKKDVWSLSTCLILAFIAGAWHEGFAVATLTGFLLYTLLRPKKFSLQWYITGVFYAAVTLVFCVCPGLMNRSTRELAVAGMSFNALKIIVDFAPVVILCGLLTIMSLNSGLRKYIVKGWKNPWFVIGTGITISGILLSLLFTHQPRSAFWPDIMAIVMILILTKPLWDKLESSAYRPYITGLAIASCVVPMAYAIIWQRAVFEESENLQQEIERSESGTVFHNTIPSAVIPQLALRMTNQGAWTTEFQYQVLGNYIGKPYTAVVPEELERIRPEALRSGQYTRIGRDEDIYKVDNSLVVPYAVPLSTIPVEVTLNSGDRVAAIALLLPYMSISGEPMTYIYVNKIAARDISGISPQKSLRYTDSAMVKWWLRN